MNEYLDFAIDFARTAGKIMQDNFHADKGISYKSDHTIVTKVDTQINQLLIQEVEASFPGHCVQGEENSQGTGRYVWVCDPVDGTAMYARGVPVAMFSLALVVDGTPVIGVAYDPFMEALYSAEQGKGAFCNGQKLQVNDLALGDQRVVANFDFYPFAEYDFGDVLRALDRQNYFVSLGSAVHACMCVASGDFAFSIFPGTTGKNYDIAAAKVIVEEAGGHVTALFGQEQRYDQDINGAIISNGRVHGELVEVIKQHLIRKNHP